MAEHSIVVSAADVRTLRGLLGLSRDSSTRDQAHVQELETELERAVVLDSAEVPSDVIRLHSRVRLLDLTSDKRIEYALVLPADGDLAANRISVLAPLGTALLGYREGDEVEWMMPGGPRRLRVERVLPPGAVRRSWGSAQAAGGHRAIGGIREVTDASEIAYTGSGT